jgi:tetratricopeptide (TPR) repeat protein
MKKDMQQVRYPEALTLKNDGNSLFKKKEFEAACYCYERAIELLQDPTNVDERDLLATLLANVSQIYIKNKDWERAEEALQKSLVLGRTNDAKVYFRLGTVYCQKKMVQQAMDFAKKAQKLDSGREVQNLIRDILAIPTYEIDNSRLRAVRFIAKGERFIHEAAILHDLRHYDVQIDRSILHDLTVDMCKALEKEMGEDMPAVLRLAVTMVLQRKHEEYLKSCPVLRDQDVANPQPQYAKWVDGIVLRLNSAHVETTSIEFGVESVGINLARTKVGNVETIRIDRATVVQLIETLHRASLELRTPYAGVRGAAVYPVAQFIQHSANADRVNCSYVASPDLVSITTLRDIKPGEDLVVGTVGVVCSDTNKVAERLRAAAPEELGTAALAQLEDKTVLASDWAAAFVTVIEERVISKGKPVVDNAAAWPNLAVLYEKREQVLAAISKESAYARTVVALALIMGNQVSDTSAFEREAALVEAYAAFPRSIMQQEKDYPKPWISTFHFTCSKLYKSLGVKFHGAVSRAVHE